MSSRNQPKMRFLGTSSPGPESHLTSDLIPGFIGNKQQWCSVCSKPASSCCRFCSTADKLFVLCNPSKRQCLTDHKANPTCAEHKFRRPHGYGVSAGSGESRSKKRARTAAAAAAKAPRRKHPVRGSRSGARATFDAQSFTRRAQRAAYGADEEEEDGEKEEEEEGEEEGEEEEEEEEEED